MAPPHPLLVEVAAGRPVTGPVPPAVVAAAAGHGMTGHLHHALVAAGTEVPPELARAELAARGRAGRWWAAAADAVARLEAAGFRALVFKGAAEEAVAGLLPGTRVPADVDVLLHPDHGDDLVAAGRALEPGHEPPPAFSIHPVMSTHVASGPLVVDLHVDPLKMAGRARGPEQAWAGTVVVPGHPTVTTLGPAAALVVRCAHHARDGYRSLEHHATIRALAQRPDLDVDAVVRWADAEGIGALVAATLRVVAEDLAIAPLLDPAWHARAPRRVGWSLARPSAGRLLGADWRPVPVRSRAEWALVRRGGAVEAVRVVTRWAAKPDAAGRGRARSLAGRTRRAIQR